MSTHFIPHAYSIAKYRVYSHGKFISQKYFEFKDPHDFSNDRLFGKQVERYKGIKTDQHGEERESEIIGIKIHSYVRHIFYMILAICTFGIIEKSLAVVLGGRKIFFYLPDYEIWRRLNGNMLNSYGLVERALFQRRSKARRAEIKKIIQLLTTPKSQRPEVKEAINNASTPFKVVKAALEWADLRIEQSKDRFKQPLHDVKETVRYQMAAYYILISSKISRDCGGEYLEFGNDLTVRQDKGISDGELKYILNAEYSKLSSREATIKMRFQAVKKNQRVLGADRIHDLIINKECDVFSSMSHLSSPIASRRILENLSNENPKIYEILAKRILQPLKLKFFSPFLDDSMAGKLLSEIRSMGAAMKEQFDVPDPDPAIFKALQFSIQEIIQNGLIKEEDQYGEHLKEAVCLGAAWRILLHPSKGKYDITYQVDQEDRIKVRLRDDLGIEDRSNIKPFSPLTGHFEGEKGSYQSAPSLRDLEILADFIIHDCFPEELFILEILIERKIYSLFAKKNYSDDNLVTELKIDLKNESHPDAKNYKGIKIKRLEQYVGFDIFSYEIKELQLDDASYERIVKAFKIAQSIGVLIQNRYYNRFANRLIGELDFDDKGNLLNNPSGSDKFRSEEDHLQMIEKYLPFLPIPLPPKEKPPCIDKIHQLKIQKNDQILSHLFHYICSEAPIGHCAVGACAQSILGLSSASNYQFIGDIGDPSRSKEIILAIREGVSKYLKDHPEQFFDYIDCMDNNPKIKTEAILRHADKIGVMKVDDTGWFELIDFVALGHIVGRSIYILEGQVEIDPFSREIKMMKVLTDMYPNIRPIFLLKKMAHYDCLLPKRNGPSDLI